MRYALSLRLDYCSPRCICSLFRNPAALISRKTLLHSYHRICVLTGTHYTRFSSWYLVKGLLFSHSASWVEQVSTPFIFPFACFCFAPACFPVWEARKGVLEIWPPMQGKVLLVVLLKFFLAFSYRVGRLPTQYVTFYINLRWHLWVIHITHICNKIELLEKNVILK